MTTADVQRLETERLQLLGLIAAEARRAGMLP